MEQITVFGKTYEISKQAKITLYSYIVALIAFVLTSLMSDASAIITTTMVMVLVIMTILGTYVVNCIVVGKCDVYAWFVTAFAIVSAIGYVITFFITLASKVNKKSRKTRK